LNDKLQGKSILVLSDNDLLARAIELNLSKTWTVDVLLLTPESAVRRRSRAGVDRHADLIVVAMSSPASEPVVALSRASLCGRIGQVPILIISDRPFDSRSDDRIIHLDFPFDINRLRGKVAEILQVDSSISPPAQLQQERPSSNV
jgi:hypothetical protein